MPMRSRLCFAWQAHGTGQYHSECLPHELQSRVLEKEKGHSMDSIQTAQMTQSDSTQTPQVETFSLTLPYTGTYTLRAYLIGQRKKVAAAVTAFTLTQ